MVLNDILNVRALWFRFLAAQTGLSEDKPYLDPCLPLGMSDTVVRDNRTLFLRGQGDWSRCQEAVRPFLGLHNGTMSPQGVYQVQTSRTTVGVHTRVWTSRTVLVSAPLLLRTRPEPSCLLQAPINFSNSEFYGFSEFFYCMEDVLRIGGQYDSGRYSQAAKVHLHTPERRLT